MDYPPSATVPVYTDKIFVKALRIPKIADEIKIKGSDIYKKNKQSSKVEKSEVKEEIKQTVNQNKPQEDIFGLFGNTTNKTNATPVINNGTNTNNTTTTTNKNNNSQSPNKKETVKNQDFDKNNQIFENLNINLVDSTNTKQEKEVFSNNDLNQFDGFEFPGVKQSENTTIPENKIWESKTNNSFVGFSNNNNEFNFTENKNTYYGTSANENFENLNKSYQEPNNIKTNNNNMKGSSKRIFINCLFIIFI